MPGKPARVTIGGIDLAVSKYSPPSAAGLPGRALPAGPREPAERGRQGRRCRRRSRACTTIPRCSPAYPFHADILTSLQNASVRPQTPAYQNISIVISHLVSPPAGIDPVPTEQTMRTQINEALLSEGLIP